MFKHNVCLNTEMSKHITRFQQYLTRIGDNSAAERFSLQPRTARAYRLGERAPKIKQIPELVKLSSGEIAYSCFFESPNE